MTDELQLKQIIERDAEWRINRDTEFDATWVVAVNEFVQPREKAIEDRRTLLRLLSESREAMEGLRAEVERKDYALSEVEAECCQLRASNAAKDAQIARMREGLSPHSKWLHLVAERLYKQQRDYSIANTCEEAADAIDSLLSRTTEGK
jgi:hypothetical protein